MNAVRGAGWVLALALTLGACGDDTPDASLAAEDAGLSRLELIGKSLFFDTSLSNPPGQSCASCHDPQRGFAGNFGSGAGVPFAADGVTLGVRNTPTAAYARFAPGFSVIAQGARQVARGGQFLDGRAASLEEQAGMPLFAAGEMNLASPAELAARLASAPYAAQLRAEFGDGIFANPALVLQAVTSAIAAFERSDRFAPFSSRFDRWLAGEATLNSLESEGLALFGDPSKGNCASCHAFDATSRDPADLLFTDFRYYSLGVPRNPRIPANADPAFFDLGLCGPRRQSVADDGLCGAFKVPTLRNVAMKQAFMHNGVFSRLRDAVEFHARPDLAAADMPAAYRVNIAPAAGPLGLEDREIDAITAFLGALDDGSGPAGVSR
ncbi:MAG TPA: cytochrome c peroxidase [Usitatibacter sp.]|nr:cytochrome c peroxidase [Usitatibacter sp.]